MIFFINKISLFIFRKSFLGYLKEALEKYCYQKKKIFNNQVIFFSPNKLIEWRVETFFEKEPETLSWIDSFETDENVYFWDIGANIGLYSLYASLKHTNINVVAFEPSTSNLRVLSRNISINHLEEKIRIINNPLSHESNKFSKFRESSFLEGGALHTYREKFDYTGKNFISENQYYLLGTNINELLDRKILELPNYIKIDVDGIEHLILQGGDKYLNHSNIKSILIEVNENFVDQFNYVNDFMYKNNFILKKKDRNDNFYQNQNFDKMYNYIFEKNNFRL